MEGNTYSFCAPVPHLSSRQGPTCSSLFSSLLVSDHQRSTEPYPPPSHYSYLNMLALISLQLFEWVPLLQFSISNLCVSLSERLKKAPLVVFIYRVLIHCDVSIITLTGNRTRAYFLYISTSITISHSIGLLPWLGNYTALFKKLQEAKDRLLTASSQGGRQSWRMMTDIVQIVPQQHV